MSDSAQAVLLREVRFAWPGRQAFRLDVAHWQLEKRQRVLLIGESGSGKSTLLSLVCGVIAADSGRIEVDGVDLGTLSSTRRDRFRAERIGIIFQQFNLLPYATVQDNILLPLRFAAARRKNVADPAAEARRLCGELGLDAGLQAMPAGRLSVGQQQRVAVARALIGRPPLIVADEPTSALDATTQAKFMDLLFRQCDDAGAALLMVSHDPRLADRFDRVEPIAAMTGTTGESR
ncbi:MAG: ABC transporter ATP-binding protein [Geminicoccaceae bacterium]|nr:ABC transporter ATP-binding protein [Geminicoccaceae bacterium]